MNPLNSDYSRDLARRLLEIQAVSLSPRAPYIWASGLRSPVYCDNRKTLGFPELRAYIADGFQALIDSNDLKCDIVGGIATAGIPHAAWLAEKMAKPMIYVRSQPKKHGRQNQIEGSLARDSSVVLIEDLVSTGLSSLAAVPAILDAGGRVSAILAIFTYRMLRAERAFKEAGISLYALTDFPTLIEIADELGDVDAGGLASLRQWYSDPEKWSDAHGASSTE